MKKNSSLLVLGFVSISLLIIVGAIQSSTAQRYDDNDDDDKDHDRDKWNRYDDDDDDDKDHDRDNFELTIRLISDQDRHMPDFKVRASGETKYIDGKEFEDSGKAKVKFYLKDVDNKERVCITNERNNDDMCKRFNTSSGEGTVKFYID